MKAIGIFVIVVLILALIYIWGMMIYNRIKFEFGFKGADLSGLNIQSLLIGGQTEATIKASAKVINNNNFSITFSNLSADIYYEDVLIAKTSDDLAKKTVVVPSNSAIEIIDNIKIYLNPQSVKMLSAVALKQSPKVQYTVKLKLYGIPLSWTDYFIWEL